MVGGAAAQATDPLAVVTAYEAAVNAHDADAGLALFADGAVVTSPPGQQVMGREQIRGRLQTLAGESVHDDVVGTPQVAGTA